MVHVIHTLPYPQELQTRVVGTYVRRRAYVRTIMYHKQPVGRAGTGQVRGGYSTTSPGHHLGSDLWDPSSVIRHPSSI